MVFGNDRTNSIFTLELISIFVYSYEIYFVYKIHESLYYLLDGYQHGLLLRDRQRIFEDDDLSFINNSLSIPLKNKQILNKFKGDDRISPIIAKFHDISCRTELPKLI